MYIDLTEKEIVELKSRLIIPNNHYPYFPRLVIDNTDVHMNKNIESMYNECFYEIKNVKGDYFISNYGRVKDFEKVLDLDYEGTYLDMTTVYLPSNGKYYIHRLMMETIHPFQNMEDYEVHHINNNALDTKIDNMLWVNTSDHRLIDAEYNEIIKKISYSIYQSNLVDQIYLFNKSQNEISGAELYKHFPNIYHKIIQDNTEKLINMKYLRKVSDDESKVFKKMIVVSNRIWLTTAST